MGWGYCGINSITGEEMGYAVTGKCSFSGCNTEIDHGLSYVCGGMHEGGVHGCGRYFCSKHLTQIWDELIETVDSQVCDSCRADYERYNELEDL